MGKFITPISSRIKSHKLATNIAKVLKEKEDKTTNATIINESFSLLKKTSLMENAAAPIQAARGKHEARVESTKVFDNNFKAVMGKIFATVVYNALPIDDSYKALDIENIYTKSEEMFTTLQESSLLTITSSPVFKAYAGSTVKYIEGFTTTLTKDEIVDVVSSVVADNITDTKVMTQTIFDKATATLKTEKELIRYRKSLVRETLENEKYMRENMHNTLFRALNEHFVKEVSERGLGSQKNIMDIALAETLYVYTIMETIHTSKLGNFDPVKLVSIAKTLK